MSFTIPIKIFLIFLFVSFKALLANAQSHFNIEGQVVNEKGEVLKSATVFIDGSQKITVTNDEGKFKIEKLSIGTYPVVVKMLGYFSFFREIQLTNEDVTLKVVLREKTFVLEEVVISTNDDWGNNYKLFKENFLGTSKNSKNCKILNDTILNFIKKEGILKASTDDFLIIENKALGYRIKYLLKMFELNTSTATTLYNGQVVFEELSGTKKEKLKWGENRKLAYYGSLMHFFRSVYQNTVLEEGFLTHHVYSFNKIEKIEETNLTIDPRPLRFDTVVYIVDSAFVSFKFSDKLYVSYDPKKSSKIKSDTTKAKNLVLNDKGSLLQLYLNEALIDHKGSVVHYDTFFIQGFWGKKRLGDQLPFEYNPI